MGLEDDEDFVLHACRHTCATRLLLEAKMDLRTVQQWMGHASVTTTEKAATKLAAVVG